ncbi:MAG: hypothetical protein U0359_23800, partial [Byssovorax sp.]
MRASSAEFLEAVDVDLIELDEGSSRDEGSGIHPRWHAHRPADSLGVSVALVAASLQIGRDGDDGGSVGMAVGSSPLRAAAWLRARGAAVGHAAARVRLAGPEGAAYELASRTRTSRTSSKTALTIGEIRSAKLGDWIAPDRVAIVLVGPTWPTWKGNEIHALVVVASTPGSLMVFDPAGDGDLDELSFRALDAHRAS